jgi:hypothetical protein
VIVGRIRWVQDVGAETDSVPCIDKIVTRTDFTRNVSMY